MNTKQAYEMGAKAHESGKSQVPAHNPEFVSGLTGNDNLDNIRAYLQGWHDKADEAFFEETGK